MSEDYCELCDLPLSTCVHGMPAPPPEPPRAAPTRTSGSAGSRATGRATSSRATSRTVSSSTSRTSSRTAAPPTRRAPRRWTPPEDFRPHVVAVLTDAGGELEADELFDRLEERVGDELLEGDRETTPEGELRWRYAARRARQAMLADGTMEKGPPGVWRLGGAHH